MKHVKHLLIAVMSVFLAFVLVVPAFAAEELPDGTEGDDKTITITPPEGVADDAENTYTVYKVFDAVPGEGGSISYKSLDGTAPDGFVVDDAQNVYLGTVTDDPTEAEGEISIKIGGATKYIVPSTASDLTAAQVAAIAAYTGKVEVGTVTITGSDPKTVTVPDYGYYYITTTTGTVVSIDSTNKSADIADKNTVPELSKTITSTGSDMAGAIDADGKKALAQLGKDVEYTATITVGDGCKDYVFHDQMGTGLTFKGNDSVTVTINDPEALPDGSTATDFYTIKPTPDSPDTLTITFVDGIADGAVITIKYVGTVNSDALTIDTGKNTAYVNYGDKNSDNHTPSENTNVYNAKFTVTKKDGDDKPLAGAGFVIKNADNKYYKKEGTVVSWVDSIDAASEYVSGTDGVVPSFTGLVNGTYTLIEKTVPEGYNKAADSTFTIAANNYEQSNLVQTAIVINNQGSELPSTGGMGTTILYTVGGCMIVAGIVMFLTKRRMASLEK